MKKHILLSLVAASLAGHALANGPAASNNIADGQWRGAIGASLATTSGASKTQTFLLNADTARLTSADKISLGAYANRGKSTLNGTTSTTANKYGARGQYDYNITSDIFGFGKLGLDADRLNRLSLRSEVSGGVGYHVIKTNTTTFDVMGGVGVVKSKYTQTETIGGRTSNSFTTTGLILAEESAHKLSDQMFFKQRLDFIPGLTGIKNNMMKFNASLSVNMSSSTALTVGVVNTYNSKVPAGLTKNEFGLFTGVSVKLGS